MTKTLGNVGADMYWENFEPYPYRDVPYCTECKEEFEDENDLTLCDLGALCSKCKYIYDHTCCDCGEIQTGTMVTTDYSRTSDPWVLCVACALKNTLQELKKSSLSLHNNRAIDLIKQVLEILEERVTK